MPKIVDHRERRSQISDAVLAIVAEEGVTGVTLRSVAERSGWSTGVLNHYVGGRDDLLRQAVRHAFWLSGRRLAMIIEDGSLSPTERLVRLLTAQVPLDEPSIAFSRITLFFYAEAAGSPEKLGQQLIDYLSAWRATVESHVRAVLVDRALPTEDAKEIADYLVALVDGFGSYAALGVALGANDDPAEAPPVDQWVESALTLSARRHI